MAQIIDGYCDFENIYAEDIGEYNIALFGNKDYVFPVGEQLECEIINNNEIVIKDGIFITQGRRGVIKKGTTEKCTIENGNQGVSRNDLIVMEYRKDLETLCESHSLKVIKGTAGVEPRDPEITTGNIPAGEIKHQMKLYRVRIEGINIVAVERLFEYRNTIPLLEFDEETATLDITLNPGE